LAAFAFSLIVPKGMELYLSIRYYHFIGVYFIPFFVVKKELFNKVKKLLTLYKL